MQQTLLVIDTHGVKHRVSREDFDDPGCTVLPWYTRKGQVWGFTKTGKRCVARGEPFGIYRSDITRAMERN